MASVHQVVEAIRRLWVVVHQSFDEQLLMSHWLRTYADRLKLTDSQRRDICSIEAGAKTRGDRHRRAVTRLKTRLLSATAGPGRTMEEDWRIMEWLDGLIKD